jgi:hypothetical protein
MKLLRDRWRRNWLQRYFADMDPMDRATALIVLALSTAIAVSFAAYVSHVEPAIGLAPSLTAPPFEMDFG